MPRRIRKRRLGQEVTEDDMERLVKEAKKRGYPVETTKKGIIIAYDCRRKIILVNPERFAVLFNDLLEYRRLDWRSEFWISMKHELIHKEQDEEFDEMGVPVRERERPFFKYLMEVNAFCRVPPTKDYRKALRKFTEDTLLGRISKDELERILLEDTDFFIYATLGLSREEIEKYLTGAPRAVALFLKEFECKLWKASDVYEAYKTSIERYI